MVNNKIEYMRKITYLMLLIVLLTASCKKEDIAFYDQPNGAIFYMSDPTFNIVFNDPIAYVNKVNSIQDSVEVNLMGMLSSKPLTLYFKTDVPSGITDVAEVTFKKNPLVFDSAKMKVVNTINIMRPAVPKKEYRVRVAFDFDKSPDFKKGAIEQQYLTIKVIDQFSKPWWWDYLADTFGAFSDAKYRLMLDISGNGELEYLPDTDQKNIVADAKAYIAAHPEKPLLDDAIPAQPITFP